MSNRRLAILASLGGLSALVVAMIAVRVVYTGNSQFVSIIWNLFLAWIPFVIALYVYEGYRRRAAALSLWAGGLLWLVFFPNAPYIVTDLKYLRTWTGAPIWYDAILLSAAAGAGLLLGFASLYVMQTVIRRALGTLSAWLFVVGVLGLSSFGVYLGRIQRWNSWDVVTRPRVLATDLWSGLENPLEHPKVIAGTIVFTVFLGATYLVFYALAGRGVEERARR